MLSERAINYYRQGYSCSCCILKAADDEYGIHSSEAQAALKGISNGFGIGIMCSVPISCIMILGLLYNDEAVIKHKRLKFLTGFRSVYKTFNCSQIQQNISRCEEVIKTGCNILEDIIKK